jgi:hypothetical protein
MPELLQVRTENVVCGECTLCCVLLPIPEINKKAGTKCSDCTLKKGCNIYATRPKPCREFNCAYIQMSKVNIKLRPDHCKIIFEKVSQRIMFGTQDHRFEPTKAGTDQIKSFNSQGMSVIINSIGKNLFIHLAHGHEAEEIHEEFKNHMGVSA